MNSGKIALLFPGQGTQYEGMGRDIYNKYPTARNVYDTAEQVLGLRLMFDSKRNLIRKILDGYQRKKLKRTDYAQLEIFVTNHAFYEVFREMAPNLKYDAVAGHSLGEYNALVAAGAICFEDALRLVHKRGLYMRDVSREVDGGLVALRVKNGEDLLALARKFENRDVYLALINSPNQIVVGGLKTALESVIKDFEIGKKVEVEGPFHTKYMGPAASQLKGDLDYIDFKLASVPIVANSSARFIVDPKDIEEELYLQLFNPVKWSNSIKNMTQQAFVRYILVGADKNHIIRNMVQQTNPNAEVLMIKDAESLEKIAITPDKLKQV